MQLETHKDPFLRVYQKKYEILTFVVLVVRFLNQYRCKGRIRIYQHIHGILRTISFCFTQHQKYIFLVWK